jgi:ATPase subunit of ABC transporter with duplicated ATPase domains
MTAFVHVSGLTLRAPGGRTLLESLELRLPAGRVALVGRNGVGKSTLLAALAGCVEADAGHVATSTAPHFVAQILPRPAGTTLSHGELRRRALLRARTSRAEIVLLDEPSEDLDDAALDWLCGWLREFTGCLVVASHDRRLLAEFRHFFVISESGCRYFSGTLVELEAELERERAATEQRDRGTPRIRLNQKRSDAQNSHGRLAKLREHRLDELRQWSQATRRALSVSLPLELALPELPEATRQVLELRGVSAKVDERWLFQSVDLRLGRQRVALRGPNGAGKTTLLELGRGAPSASAEVLLGAE